MLYSTETAAVDVLTDNNREQLLLPEGQILTFGRENPANCFCNEIVSISEQLRNLTYANLQITGGKTHQEPQSKKQRGKQRISKIPLILAEKKR